MAAGTDRSLMPIAAIGPACKLSDGYVIPYGNSRGRSDDKTLTACAIETPQFLRELMTPARAIYSANAVELPLSISQLSMSAHRITLIVTSTGSLLIVIASSVLTDWQPLTASDIRISSLSMLHL